MERPRSESGGYGWVNPWADTCITQCGKLCGSADAAGGKRKGAWIQMRRHCTSVFPVRTVVFADRDASAARENSEKHCDFGVFRCQEEHAATK